MTYKHIKGFIYFISIIFLITSCGGDKEAKKVSPESMLVNEAFELAEILRNAYIKKDRVTLEMFSTPAAYQSLVNVIKNFDSAELTFTPIWVELQDSTLLLTVSWKGTWSMKGKMTEERGIGVFVLEEKPLKLSQINRANPFSQPE